MGTEAASVGASIDVTIAVAPEIAEILFKALKPETERPSSARSEVMLCQEGKNLKLSIKASDLTAIRAATNSYLRWVEAVLDALERVSLGSVTGNNYKHVWESLQGK